MSQEKVDAYKKEKATRKQALAKKKREDLMYKLLGGLIGLLVLVWIVCSIGWKYWDWPNPLAKKQQATTHSAEELSSIQAALESMGIITTSSEGGDSEDTTTTVASEDEEDATTAAKDTEETSASETDTTEESAAE